MSYAQLIAAPRQPVGHPVRLNAKSAQALLEDVDAPLHLALRGEIIWVAGGCKLHYKLPQRIWLLFGYAADRRDLLLCAQVIASSPDRRPS